MSSAFEQPLRDHLSGLLASASHGFAHLDRVLDFALGLQATYGGDVDVITAAVLLHDLGRNDPALQGKDSADHSVEAAHPLLEAIGFPADRAALALQAIAEHDQPALRPTTIEGRILKDADFLAGFGAHGVARIALWTGESGGDMDALMDRLERKMAARIAALEFAQSRAHATRDYVFVRLFVDKLRARPALRPLPPQPYVVIEGISGSGKTTQIHLLAARFAQAGRTAVVLHEPTHWYRQMKASLPDAGYERPTQLLLLIVDRWLHVRRDIEAAEAAGHPVLSDRSYLSSMVYQQTPGNEWLTAEHIAYLHGFLPQPTHLFVLDVPPEEALRRIDARLAAEGGTRGDHETGEQLAEHRERFRTLGAILPHLRVLDAHAQTAEELHETIWTEIQKL